MSGAARRRGAGRATRGQASETSSSRRGDRLQVPAGGFDGPASRGSASASGPGSQGRQASTAPSVGSGRGSPNPPQGGFAQQGSQPASRRSSQSGGPPPQTQPASPTAQHAPVTRGDPARDHQPRYTDQLRNLDLPASFYNIDQLVSAFLDLKRPVNMPLLRFNALNSLCFNSSRFDSSRFNSSQSHLPFLAFAHCLRSTMRLPFTSFRCHRGTAQDTASMPVSYFYYGTSPDLLVSEKFPRCP
ncbi:hypothetical protein A1O1_08381 [Capronia coronata CBS 617.96]|uniref:Uncharacterized protein n=1 Tax=Capronia coronata CBS 617.96 TaxID=1182541 RepID=W9YD31_9EURO|nr:uncharacterized protein A1O1_08381 [Capronia coronata CBS 617.96]EXJ80239.1 hypothetical protein A1O1_08381 [Capronia coronata CBS 617.96]